MRDAPIRVAASAVIDAPPQKVCAVIADYHNGHPRIVPAKCFSGMEVERGGVGAGTLVRFQMHTLGTTRTYLAEITEPEPGRVLVETNLGSGEATTFTVDPADGGRASVTIVTEWAARGCSGLVQRLLAPPLLRRIYAEEFRNLARVAAG
jgi:hypothetical protein